MAALDGVQLLDEAISKVHSRDVSSTAADGGWPRAVAKIPLLCHRYITSSLMSQLRSASAQVRQDRHLQQGASWITYRYAVSSTQLFTDADIRCESAAI